MNGNKLRVAAAVLATALVAGCAGKGRLKTWPHAGAKRASPPATGVLFKLNVDLDMSGFYVQSLWLFFGRGDEPEAQDMTKPNRGMFMLQRLMLEAEKFNKFPNDLVLLPLEPGRYKKVAGIIYYWGNASHDMMVHPSNSFADFEVKPGQVTVLGELDLKVVLKVLSADSSGQRRIETTLTQKSLDSPEKKREVLELALERPEADKLGWRDALEAARAETVAAPKP